MYSSIIFKEWLKTRRVFFIALAVALLVAVYVILRTNSLINEHGIVSLWLSMLLKDVSYVDTLTYIPLAVGLALGIAQMVPEVAQKRLKLTLHLPFPQLRLVAMMLATGLLELLVIYLLQAGVILIYDATIFHSELVGRVFLTMLPWYLAGFIGYLFVTSVCLEGTWYMRILLGLVGVAVLLVMFLQPTTMAAYNYMIVTIVVFIALITIFSFGSIARFKEGHQD
ncbi:MAG: hypothetical protein K2M54_09115 [Muribaculaceae bacterium]|nr:hypothetical protein [Muribaculaceae bacterium]